MRERLVRLRLPLVLCVLLLCAAATSGWAAPIIQMYAVKHTTLTRSYLPGGEPIPRWAVAVGMCMRDSAGVENISDVTVWDPAGEPLPNDNVHWPWIGSSECSACICLLWEFPSEPPLGSYSLQAHGEDGSESAVVLTAPFDHFPEPVPEITYPAPGSTIMETAPEFTWLAYPGFACEGGAAADSQYVQVSTPDETEWLWTGYVPVEATSVLYDGPPLEPGHEYTVHLWESRDWVWVDSDPSGWYGEETRADSTFAIHSPDPVVEQAVICRGRFLWEPGATEETHHESAQITARDWEGPQGLSVTTLAPDGTSHPTPEDGGATWDDGEYRLYQNWCHNPLAPLPAGAYEITAEDAQGHTGSLLTSEASELPPMFAMVYPLDGEVIPEWDTQPVFSWEPALGADQVCVCVQTPGGEVLWLKQGLPDTSASVQYNDDGTAALWELSPGSTYRVHVRAVYEEEQPSPNATVRGYVGRTTEFTLFSPIPVIQDVNICRGRDTDAPDWAKYHERVWARVRDFDGAGDIASITMTDSAGVEHVKTPDCGCWWPEDDLTITCGWCNSSLLSPPPAGTYEIRAVDSDGNEAVSIVTPEVPEVSEVHPELVWPAMDSVIYERTPTFEWTPGVPGSVYNLDIYEEGTWERIWSTNLGEGTEAPYNFDDSALREQLEPNRSYFWVVNSGYVEDDRVSDPRVWVYAAQDTRGRFTVYGDWPELPPALPGNLAYTAASGDWAYASSAAYTIDPHVRVWLGPDGAEAPDWSPDGATLLYSKDNTIWMDPLDGSAAVHIPGIAGGGCRWAPDGNRLCFQMDNEVVVADIDGSSVHSVAAECGMNPWPAWSPDGQWISYRRTGEPGLWMVRPDGTEDHPVNATDVAGYPGCTPIWMGGAAWSPEARKLAVSFSAASPEGDISGIGVIPPEGGLLTPVFVAPPGVICCAAPQNPQWSPDGAEIAFNSGHHLPDPAEWAFEPRVELWMVNADGSGEPVRLTYDNSYDYAISWWAPNTNPGTHVSITKGDVTVTFSKVTAVGSTMVCAVDPPPSPPTGYAWITQAFHISTTATVQGAVSVAIKYDRSLVPGGKAGRLVLLHFEAGKWVDVTDEVDPKKTVVRGAIPAPPASGGTTDLSLFAIAVRNK